MKYVVTGVDIENTIEFKLKGNSTSTKKMKKNVELIIFSSTDHP